MNNFNTRNIDLQPLIEQHFENINNLSQIINDSNNMIMTLMRTTNTTNSTMNNNRNVNRNNIRYNRNMFNTIPRNNIHNSFVNNTTHIPSIPTPTFNNDNNDNFVIRFETLLPYLFDNLGVDNNTNIFNNVNDISYNIGRISHDISQVDVSMIENHDLLDIQNYSAIQNHSMNDICPITRERFYDNQNVMMICRCKHVFNKSSLNIWLRNNNTCPSCRTRINRTSNNMNEMRG